MASLPRNRGNRENPGPDGKPAILVGCAFVGLLFWGCSGPARLALPGVRPEVARHAIQESRRIWGPKYNPDSYKREKASGIKRFESFLDAEKNDESKQTQIEILQKAEVHFRTAIEANPWDVDGLLYLMRIRTRLGALLPQKDRGVSSSVPRLAERALRLDRGGGDIWFALAEYHRLNGSWNLAFPAYRQALDLLWKYDFLPRDLLSPSTRGTLDSALVFRCLYRLGEASVKLYDAREAARYFENGYLYARTREERDMLDAYLRWLRWGEGNIEARELFEQAEAHENEGRFQEAAGLFQRVAELTRGRGGEAHLESVWRLSKLLYAVFPDSAAAAAGKMRELAGRIPRDRRGAPVDSVHSRYIGDYSRMLWNEALKSKDRKASEALLMEGSVLYSPLQARFSLRLSRLMQNAPHVGLSWALKAYTLRDRLDEDERAELFVLLKRVTRRPRNPFLTRYFNERFVPVENGNAKMDPETELMALEFLRSSYLRLDQMLFDAFQVHQHESEAGQYARLYEQMESRMSPARRQSIRNQITAYYQTHYDKPVLAEWRLRLAALRQRGG